MKIVTIVGARPQFIKAAMVSRAIAAHNRSGTAPEITEQIIHTGQHYDENMSDIFFQQMNIPEPAVNLDICAGLHGEMTARMLENIEREIVARKPDWVLVYGDTNSTLAGALAAVKLNASLAHVEAGLRSFNKRMPEEINRILTDHVSSLLFCPTRAAVANLAKEGITRGVYHVGDVMYDAALVFGEMAPNVSTVLSDLQLVPKEYLLATVHRAENTDDQAKFKRILSAFAGITERIVLPIHPRTRARLDAFHLKFPRRNLMLVDPVSYLDMVQLEKHARVVLTDSGGVQKEAYFHGVPCVTLRDETEWVETVAAGWNQVVGTDPGKIVRAVGEARTGERIEEYGKGNAAETIIQSILSSPNREDLLN